jgi:hypothetical protein
MKWLTASVLAALLALPISTAAGDAADRQKRAEALAREAGELASEAIREIMRSMDAMLRSVPLYEEPEVLPNGDIIIRRKHPKLAPRDDKPNPDETRT